MYRVLLMRDMVVLSIHIHSRVVFASVHLYMCTTLCEWECNWRRHFENSSLPCACGGDIWVCVIYAYVYVIYVYNFTCVRYEPTDSIGGLVCGMALGKYTQKSMDVVRVVWANDSFTFWCILYVHTLLLKMNGFVCEFAYGLSCLCVRYSTGFTLDLGFCMVRALRCLCATWL